MRITGAERLSPVPAVDARAARSALDEPRRGFIRCGRKRRRKHGDDDDDDEDDDDDDNDNDDDDDTIDDGGDDGDGDATR